MRFAPQPRAFFQHLNLKKWPEPIRIIFKDFDLKMFAPQLRAIFPHWNFKNCSDEVFCTFDLKMRFAPGRRGIFRHRNYKNWSEAAVFCTFWLENLLRARWLWWWWWWWGVVVWGSPFAFASPVCPLWECCGLGSNCAFCTLIACCLK